MLRLALIENLRRRGVHVAAAESTGICGRLADEITKITEKIQEPGLVIAVWLG